MSAPTPPPNRRLGDGYEPHVDEVDGKLVYSLPVDSGFASASFSFEIAARDLDVLRADPYRRAVLESVAHTILQPSLQRGGERVTQDAFADLVSRILHSTPAELEALIAAVDRDHNIVTRFYVEQAMARRAGTADRAGR